jgi:hypothetical protein
MIDSDDINPVPDLLRRLAAHGCAGQVGTDPVTVDVLRVRRMIPADARPMLDAVLQALCDGLDSMRSETRDTDS